MPHERCLVIKANYQKQLSKIIIKGISKIVVIVTKSKITTDQILILVILSFVCIYSSKETTLRAISDSDHHKVSVTIITFAAHMSLCIHTIFAFVVRMCPTLDTKPICIAVSSTLWDLNPVVYKSLDVETPLTTITNHTFIPVICFEFIFTTQHAQCVIIAACVVDLGNQ